MGEILCKDRYRIVIVTRMIDSNANNNKKKNKNDSNRDDSNKEEY